MRNIDMKSSNKGGSVYEDSKLKITSITQSEDESISMLNDDQLIN